MIIMPPEEIKKYISVDESGQWIHDPDMPVELEMKYEEFVKNVEKIKKHRMEQ